ncbi:MAG: hypothetical protein JWQ46_2011 [Phenylobacterium sp.]|nr:hypothetical protein [Phenylobacterium sp.]
MVGTSPDRPKVLWTAPFTMPRGGGAHASPLDRGRAAVS